MRRSQRGMVTAELAVGFVVGTLVLLAGLWGITAIIWQVRCLDTAAMVARQLARDDHAAAQRALAGAPGARADVRFSMSEVAVRLTWESPSFGLLPELPLQATATARREPR